MNKTCQFFIWIWVLLLSITLVLFGSTLAALGDATGDSVALGFGITFIVFGCLLLLTSPCTYSYVGYLCHWMDHCYPGKCCAICEESRGQECQDPDCWIDKWPWKCACFCATFSGFTTHLHQHRKGEGCSASDECWIRRLRDVCCGRNGSGNNDDHHPCIQLRLCVICMDAPPIMSILPCGHRATCADCAQSLVNTRRPCPICRGSIASVVRIYT